MNSNTLVYPFFKIEKEYKVNSEDFKNLRKFYTPFLNPNSIILYEYLWDLVAESNSYTSNFDFNNLATFINQNYAQINEARVALEAAGLIETFVDDQNHRTVFYLLKPLDQYAITKNKYISDLLKNKLGQWNFELLMANNNKQIERNKNSYEEISTTFFEYFGNPSKDLQEQINYTNNLQQSSLNMQSAKIQIDNLPQLNISQPLKMNNIKYTNLYEAIFKLDNFEFYAQISKNTEIKIEESQKIQTLLLKIKDEQILNLVFLYTHLKNKSNFSFKLSEKLITQLIEMSFVTFSEAESFLDYYFKAMSLSNAYEEKSLLRGFYYEGTKAKNA
ncbi:hypothetical protein V2E24_00355 [Mycoplasmopsis ciconiae]|uniref:DnaD domain-containing protein n=1 Tax=Mycoplasmopsis ciconiae TaxID=561067 RepID=A0ABU7MKH0_9BACT|nr:hypothetical protein [Mycoplasmopsis ciconiae]